MKYGYICLGCSYPFVSERTLEDYCTAQTVVQCPNCYSFDVRRTYHSIPVIYKGDGFTKSVEGSDDE